jgi:hypothetical protein
MIFADVDSRKSIRTLFNEFGADLEGVVFIKSLITYRVSNLKIKKILNLSDLAKIRSFPITSLNHSQHLPLDCSQLLTQLHLLVQVTLLIQPMSSYSQFLELNSQLTLLTKRPKKHLMSQEKLWYWYLDIRLELTKEHQCLGLQACAATK